MPALRTRDTQSRTLDVTTDAPQPPSLHIVSPTPRAFTFPINHNLSDSPYASPSSSPFEPDLCSLPSQCTLSASSSSATVTPPRNLSPDSPIRSSSPSSVNLKRRKSSSSSDVVERRPKKGDEDYIKRPENAFILFRRKCCEDRQQSQEEAAASAEGPAKKQRQADLSKTISQQWKSLSAEERKYWEDLAKNKKAEHEKMYPNYVYRPQRAKDKDGKAKNKKLVKKGEQEETPSVSFVVPVPRHHGRSASAPTPPPYQSIQIPNVYHMTPSCPTSPSLLPMISRRSAHPGHPEDVMASFDFIPNQNAFVPPPSFPIPNQFEATLQSSEFLRSMFNTTGHRHSEPTLQQLTVPEGLLPPHQIVSPPSSISSGSSGPSSPLAGPYTPTSSLLPQNYTQLSADASLEAQAQAEMELQLEMQMQQEFAAYNWESSNLWPSESSVLLGDDFDINAIRPVELGMPKYTENIALAAPNAHNLEFGQEFTHALEGAPYPDDSHMGLLNFDDMMAGHSF
ncbi:hypothetical protein CVT26_014468 [Gymnopilus dilepis]|uniref:HMG box domain-containing protein n=1 Tax=Gymnopilus dilepis TaxID=231916 RepID=A0A409VVC9_9AGAR|nr:hypothetical protein CVT26_014468 [Gymnopilus dilepis]